MPQLVHDPLRAVNELREQLSSHSRRLGFFMGSGTSMAAGLPGIEELTTKVASELEGVCAQKFDELLQACRPNATVEDVLNKARLIQELLGRDSTQEVAGVSSAIGRELDTKICSAITKVLSVDPPKGLQPHLTLARWVGHIAREQPVEIFTTNYDLLFERAFEEASVPYFDGFVGTVGPFFVQDSVEADGGEKTRHMYPPTGWTRLWKVHGSIGWRMNLVGGKKRITRTLGPGAPYEGDLVIHPSRDKFADSRKLPFMTYLDRLRRFLSAGECMLIVIGYSFRDEHLNATMYDALRSNNRLAVTVLLYASPGEDLLAYVKEFRNLSVLDPDAACIGGVHCKWSEPPESNRAALSLFWDVSRKIFVLGDFAQFASYLSTTLDVKGSSSRSGAGSAPA